MLNSIIIAERTAFGAVNRGSVIPKKVIFNPPATIVIWEDGEKTVVKVKKGTPYVPDIGFLMCLAKKTWGDRFHAIMRDMVWENEDAGKSIAKWARRLIAEMPQGGVMVWSNDPDTLVKKMDG